MFLPTLRSSNFVVAIEAESRTRKVLQFQFRKTDGSIFVHFPYFQHMTGLVSRATMHAGPRAQDLKLEHGGKVSSHLVKYSHHPDGRAHFSQDTKVLSRISKQATPLREVHGHLFTVHVHGLQGYADVDEKDIKDREPNPKRTVLTFRTGDQSPESLKLIGWLYPAATLEARMVNVGPQRSLATISDDGTIRAAFACAPPAGKPGDDRVLLMTCEVLSRLDSARESSLLFLGGFDAPDIVDDLTKPTTVLALSYPLDDPDAFRQRIGSIDFEAQATP
jgi:hypothetical protein